MTIQTVLLIDDEPDIRRVGQLSLERVGGFQVLVATSGAQAVALLEAPLATPPDVILLDVMMPGLDGPETYARLKPLLDPRTPVVFMTARAQPHELSRYVALGAAGVVTKPFDPMKLPAELQALVDAWAAGR